MHTNQLKSEALRAAQQSKKAGLTQINIANALGVSQSQVSRILSGHVIRRSKLFKEICGYAEASVVGVTPELVKKNTELIEALAETWDGSPSHAKSLAVVIRSLGALDKGARIQGGLK